MLHAKKQSAIARTPEEWARGGALSGTGAACADTVQFAIPVVST
jgi:hypothetical protein